MRIVDKKISIEELKKLAKSSFGDLVKAVVDIEKKIMIVGGELHADEEALLIENGSEQKNLWGINIYPDLSPEDESWVEFDSMINLKPSQENRSRGVDNPETQKIIVEVVEKLVSK